MSNGYPEQVRNYLSHPWQLFKTAWQFYRRHFKLIIQITVWPALVGILSVLPTIWLQPVFSILSLVVVLLAQAAIIHLLTRGAENELPTFQSAYKHAWGFFFSLLWLNLLMLVIMFGGFVILVIPGLIWTVYLMFSVLVLMDQKRRGLSALIASWSYAEGYWWSILGRVLFLILLMLPIAAAVSLLAWAVGQILPFDTFILRSAISILGTWFLISPLSLIYFFYIYSELKSLKPNVEVENLRWDFKQRWLIAFTIIGAAALGVFLVLALVSLSFVLGLLTGAAGGVPVTPDLIPKFPLPPGTLSPGAGFWEFTWPLR